ncbi:hypothetical protein CR513_05453, partial [Mucuna pruriens]
MAQMFQTSLKPMPPSRLWPTNMLPTKNRSKQRPRPNTRPRGPFFPSWFTSRCLKLKKNGIPWKNDSEGKQLWTGSVDLCLVLDVGLSVEFKTPEFDKYKGSSYPRVHLAMYFRKMEAYIHDDKILIDCFEDSLMGVALGWYVSLERGCIKTWRDLAEAFLKQYK